MRFSSRLDEIKSDPHPVVPAREALVGLIEELGQMRHDGGIDPHAVVRHLEAEGVALDP